MRSQIFSEDVKAVFSLCQQVSEEIVFDRVIERLMVGAVAYVGAMRGLLILRDTGPRIVAKVMIIEGSVQFIHPPYGPLDVELPPAALAHVRQAFRPWILGDAPEEKPAATDPHIIRIASRSMLCLPVFRKERLVGMLYIESRPGTDVFSPGKVSALQMLAAQAAISIENAENFHDVQEARDHARQLGDELRRYFDNLPVMAWQNSADGELDFANKRWHDYTGSSPDDEPLEVWSYFHPDDREQVAERWRYLLEHRIAGEIEARMRRFDGQYRSFLVRAMPLLDERGVIVKWHGTNTDIEDLKRAAHDQEALARVSRLTAMGELTISIAHEVNQPLMAIVTTAASCLRWLTGDTLDVAQARAAAERIVRDGHRAGEVLASIRAMAQKGPVTFVPVDVNDTLKEVLALTRNEMQRHGITVETRFSPDVGMALGDRVQIQQVVLNLIMNGIEAMSGPQASPRVLLVQTENVGEGFVQATVSDSGHGVHPEAVDQIFDAFFTTKADGLGMGLSICRSIVENHGGQMAVEANLPHGCTFSVRLPAVPPGHRDADPH